MKIVVDCRYTRTERHDGISRYTAGLVTALAERRAASSAQPLRGTPPALDVTMLISDERQLALLPALPYEQVSGPTSAREPLVARQVRRLAPDVVFSPMQTMGSWGRDYRLVLTVHDLIYYRNPTPPPEFPAPIRLLWRLYHTAWWPQRLLLNRADAVVAVSGTTAALIAEHRLTRRPVTVVPNAADPVPDASRLPRTSALVYMGSFMPYKNVATLARAMAALPGHELHLMSRVTAAQRAGIEAAAGSGRLVFHDGASDATYQEVLRGATALVSASRDEGFGIPLVEAMAVGTPLVVSDIPVFREVGGASGAAEYVAPDDVAGFVAAIGRIEERWERASTAARDRGAGYTWEHSAERLLELLTSLGSHT